MKILITGATGFIGSNIAKSLLEEGFKVYATYRTSSSFEKCHKFKNSINWINTEHETWKEEIRTIKPDQLIHVAWGGIEAGDRNNWDIQISNFWFSKELFDIAKDCGIKKIIGIGSQAEYGIYDFPVKETTAPMPVDAYGAVKTLTANYLRNISQISQTEWYWVRIFSIFGEGENSSWLIPSVISKLKNHQPIALTSCNQKYNYLYIKDFISQFLEVVKCEENKSGIYNLCDTESIPLKAMLIQLTKIMNVPSELLQFGRISYRSNQNMLIAGDNSKFNSCFPLKDSYKIGLMEGLKETIEYYEKEN